MKLATPTYEQDFWGRGKAAAGSVRTQDGAQFMAKVQAAITTGAGVVVAVEAAQRAALGIDERIDGRLLGWYDRGGVYLRTLPALDVVRAAQDMPAAAWLTPWSLNKQLAALGVLATMGSTTITVKKRVAGNSYSTLHFRPGVLDVGHYAETWESWVSGDSTRG
jgi:hypothetical protein